MAAGKTGADQWPPADDERRRSEVFAFRNAKPHLESRTNKGPAFCVVGGEVERRGGLQLRLDGIAGNGAG
jgi:hypothetical protein